MIIHQFTKLLDRSFEFPVYLLLELFQVLEIFALLAVSLVHADIVLGKVKLCVRVAFGQGEVVSLWLYLTILNISLEHLLDPFSVSSDPEFFSNQL